MDWTTYVEVVNMTNPISNNYFLVDTGALEILLKKTQRPHFIGGSKSNQVTSCVLVCVDGRMRTTSIVKDGVTSVSHFSVPLLENGESYVSDKTYDGNIYVSDIDTLLGVLKYHGGKLKIHQSPSSNKVRLISNNKTTTIDANPNAKAFTNSNETLESWLNKSITLMAKINQTSNYNEPVTYTAANETVFEPCVDMHFEAIDLYEALRTDNMNGQKLNRYTVELHDRGLYFTTGAYNKGKNLTQVNASERGSSQYLPDAVTFSGGLEQTLAHINGKVRLSIFDFSQYEQGHRLLLSFGEGTDDFLLQASVTR